MFSSSRIKREVTLADVFKLAKTMSQSKAAGLETRPETERERERERDLPTGRLREPFQCLEPSWCRRGHKSWGDNQPYHKLSSPNCLTRALPSPYSAEY